MKTDHYHLKIVPIEEILTHEKFDCSRTEPLVKKLIADGRITNPIIVAEMDSGKYLQLDGMNRLSAFKKLGFKTILVQIVDYNDQENVDLSSWTHLFKANPLEFINEVKQIDGLTVKEGKTENVGYRYIKEKGLGRLCTVCSKNKKVYLISTNGDLMNKVSCLNKIVEIYEKNIVRDILLPYLNKGDIYFLFNQHHNNNMMLVFPTFTRHQVIKVVENGGYFPAGLTRHIIRRRCLNVNLDLKVFEAKNSLAKQNRILEKFITSRPFRVFEEQVIYFE